MSVTENQQLDQIIHSIHEAKEFHDLIPNIQTELLQLLNAEGFTLYFLSPQKTLTSQFIVGADVKPFTLPASTSSIAGFVALTHRPVVIKNAYDQAELQAIHADLRFNQSIDRQYGFKSQSMIVVPIMVDKVSLGVLQVINHKCGFNFSKQNLKSTMIVASVLGKKFQRTFKVSAGPFELLIRSGRLSAAQLKQFSSQAQTLNISLAHFLLTEKKFNHDEIGQSLENYYQKPYQNYDSSLHVRFDLIQHIKKSYLTKNCWVPVMNEKNELFILIDDPTDDKRIMELLQVLRLKEYNFRVAIAEVIQQLIQHGAMDSRLDAGQLITELQQDDEPVDTQIETEEPLDSEEPIIIRLINQIIRDAINHRASDIHIEPGLGKSTSTVRYRIDGVCTQTLSIPASHQQAIVSRIKIISNLDISERRLPQDGKCVIRNKGKRIELRVATIPTVNGEAVVMRILNSSTPLPLDKLRLSKRNLIETQRLLTRPHGIFLAVGPTGSGKTTTLHALLAHINTPERKIWTAEDPVEITQAGLQQLQVNHKIGLTFATALRSFLRADPDVIMVGEMRDQETTHIGIEASLTGHLVFSTLHTNSASETITRLLDLGMDPINFSDALLGILAQRLVRSLCQHCKQKTPATAKEMAFLHDYHDQKTLELHHPVGCKSCNQTGYHGRIGIHELLVATPEIKALIYQRASVFDIQKLAAQQGTQSLLHDGIQKVLAGLTDIEQLQRIVNM